MAECTIYSDENVNVTTARVVIHGTTYALRNITSVKMASTPANTGCAILLRQFGILMLFGAFLAFVGAEVGSGFVILLFAGGVLTGAMFWLRACKPSYHVAIASASGESHALTSKDKQYISKVVESINDAIIQY
jgi:hypothetical protein